MNKLRLFVIALAVSALTFTSCKKDDPDDPISSETVYILGTYNTESFLMTNGQIHYFQRADERKVAAIDMDVRDNGDVYVVGELRTPLSYGEPPQSILYKNNVECSEYSFDASVFSGIAFKENGDMIIAGLQWGQPVVWDGTNVQYLPVIPKDDINVWIVSSIEYVDGNEFIVGTCVDTANVCTPVVWMNRQLVEVGLMDNASTIAYAGTLTHGTDFKLVGSYVDADGNIKACEYNSQQHGFSNIPYRWPGSNESRVYGEVNSSKWNDASGSIYSLVTECYSEGYIDPITGEIGAIDTISGGFYILKDGQVMPQSIYQYPKENTLASIIDMTMNSEGQIVAVGTLYDNEYQGVRPAYWVDGECHIINPDRPYDDGVASRVIIKNIKK